MEELVGRAVKLMFMVELMRSIADRKEAFDITMEVKEQTHMNLALDPVKVHLNTVSYHRNLTDLQYLSCLTLCPIEKRAGKTHCYLLP